MMSLPVWLPVPMFLLGGQLVPCSFQGVSLWGKSAYGGVCLGGSASRGGWTTPSPEPEKQAVCILLECFLDFGLFQVFF